MARRFIFADEHAAGVPREKRQVYALVEELPMQGLLRVHRWGDDQAAMASIPSHWLVEIKPPSIDDPVTLPLNLFSSSSDGHVALEVEEGETVLRVRVRGDHIKHTGGVFDYSDSQVVLEPADLRDLARAAWQRANQIEGGA